MDYTNKQREIQLKLIGTAGQLDKAEGDYAVYTIEDVAGRAHQLILNAGSPYKKEGYGWSIILAEIGYPGFLKGCE